jgi:alkylation response protein AidB-like acyl-CoA dehydrogenase
VLVVGDDVSLAGAAALAALETADLTRRFATVDPAAARERLATPALDRWRGTVTLAAGADALGACRTLLATTTAYACQRRQFGREIGTFQAVRHGLVDLALALERATASTYLAAMLVDAADPRAALAVHAARASTAGAVARFTRAPVQLHGAIGYTWEHDVHLYVRRAYVSDRLFGSGAWHRACLGAAILEDPQKGEHA